MDLPGALGVTEQRMSCPKANLPAGAVLSGHSQEPNLAFGIRSIFLMRKENSECYIAGGGEGVKAKKAHVGSQADLCPLLQVRPLFPGPIQ